MKKLQVMITGAALLFGFAATANADWIVVEEVKQFVSTAPEHVSNWQVAYLGGPNGSVAANENFDWSAPLANPEYKYRPAIAVSPEAAEDVYWNTGLNWITANTNDGLPVFWNGYFSYKVTFADELSNSSNNLLFNGLAINFASDDHLHAILINGKLYDGFDAQEREYEGWIQSYEKILMSDISWNVGGENTIEFIVHNNNSGSGFNDVMNATGASFEINAIYLEQRDAGTPVPEPTTMLLFGTGLLGLAGISRRRRSN
ncbi:MAG: PEP-CTERM sorting domain-containing protein [Proteobacteria bacterium]|nr:PEP-CTERM sorting domain-containing protein [Pseudomonadota bacterium]